MKKFGVTGISGLSDSRTALVMSQIIKENAGKTLIIVPTASEARELADDISFFLNDTDVVVMPEEYRLFLSFDARDQEGLVQRLRGINALLDEGDTVVVAPASAAVKKMIPHHIFSGKDITLTFGEQTDTESLKGQLTALGYERVSMVESRGEFSLRGGILDVFPPESAYPYRIEFFDTEVDSVRTFDTDTQRSIEGCKSVRITPARQLVGDAEVFRRAEENVRRAYSRQISKLSNDPSYREAVENLGRQRDMLCEHIRESSDIQLLENYIHYFYPEQEYLWEYPEECNLLIDDPDRIAEALEASGRGQKEDFELLLETGKAVPQDSSVLTGPADFRKAYKHRPLWLFTPFPKMLRGIDRYDGVRDYASRPATVFGGRMDAFVKEVKHYLERQFTVHIVCSSDERLETVKEFCAENGIAEGVRYTRGQLSHGMEFTKEKLCYITEREIFGESRNKKRRKKTSVSRAQENLADLRKGDYVVHENHGIGRFDGIETIAVDGEQRDYLKIRYAGTDLLYVPAEQFGLVEKYIGSEGTAPKINRLSGDDWKLTKARAKAAIREMTDELIEIYARRELREAYRFAPDTPWQREFEDDFPYAETEDQLRSVEEIKRDMESPRPMDRLLCGDVGFGKTEVAARAIFKCVAEGKQAAVLVPTTLLANQHYFTLSERFSRFPVTVEMLSRFRTPEEQKEILKKLKSGDIDVIIGTHRLLSQDVKYKDPGLLVIDEEQRFGVAHKEKIKKLKENIDVLTLSATPIPRTLNMSLTGIRDMSVIEEPPENRYPVQTYVMEEDDAVIREAVLRETGRGGQVFVIFNRVNGINRTAAKIRELVPEARVCSAHGRMSESRLEDVMLSFVNGEYDILVATSILESGIDIPNANTLIVLDADRFGLAQLYQLRGRVGRSDRVAFAYLMYRKDKVLTEASVKRLKAIREFTEFGSGYKVALRDLQIRGAGNLLGSEQSGHIMNIGYELYCRLVNDAVKRLRGETVPDEPGEVQIELKVSAGIPDRYIEDEALRIRMYKKIAEVGTAEEEYNICDEMTDRFGDVPRETVNLIRVARIRSLALKLSVSRISEQGRYVVTEFYEKNSLTAQGILKVGEKFGNRALVNAGINPVIRIPLREKRKLEDEIELLSAADEGIAESSV